MNAELAALLAEADAIFVVPSDSRDSVPQKGDLEVEDFENFEEGGRAALRAQRETSKPADSNAVSANPAPARESSEIFLNNSNKIGNAGIGNGGADKVTGKRKREPSPSDSSSSSNSSSSSESSDADPPEDAPTSVLAPSSAPIRRSYPSSHCRQPGCPRVPRFGHDGTRTALFCSHHKTLGMVEVWSRSRCTIDGCLKHAWHKFDGEADGFCDEHHVDSMTTLHRKRCEQYHCKERAVFGSRVGGAARFCAVHRMDGTVNVFAKKRDATVQKDAPAVKQRQNTLRDSDPESNSDSSSSDSNFSRRAKILKPANPSQQPNLRASRPVSKQCRHPDCPRFPSYGTEHTNKKLFCSVHKPMGAVLIGSKHRCLAPLCFGYSWYRALGSKRGYCELHRELGSCVMPAHRKSCEAFDCGSPAQFGARVGGPARFCAVHRMDGTVDVFGNGGDVDAGNDSRAVGEPKLASEGSESSDSDSEDSDSGSSTSSRSANASNPPNAKQQHIPPKARPPSKKCRHPGCTHTPAYGPEFTTKKLYCTAHKPLGAVHVAGTFRCNFPGCLGFQWYRVPKSDRGYCELHRDREPGVRPVKRHGCEAFKCQEAPRFGARVGGPARFCATHRMEGTVDVFGESGEPKAVMVEAQEVASVQSDVDSDSMDSDSSDSDSSDSDSSTPSSAHHSNTLPSRNPSASQKPDPQASRPPSLLCRHPDCHSFAGYG